MQLPKKWNSFVLHTGELDDDLTSINYMDIARDIELYDAHEALRLALQHIDYAVHELSEEFLAYMNYKNTYLTSLTQIPTHSDITS